MISRLMKMLLAATTAGVSLYGMSVFGASPWPAATLAAALFLAASAFTPRLDAPARIAGHVIGGLSLLALLLLLLAATIGGGFHLSPSNEVIAVFLFLMTLFGLTSLLWPRGRKRRPGEGDSPAGETGHSHTDAKLSGE